MWPAKDVGPAWALIGGLAGLSVTGLLAFSDGMGGRGARRRRAATHGGLSRPSPPPAAPPPGSPRTPPTPAAQPAARAPHQLARQGARARVELPSPADPPPLRSSPFRARTPPR